MLPTFKGSIHFLKIFQLLSITSLHASRWQNLVTRAEERHKLVTASLNFYKTAEQVCSVLDSLEREYKREDDWLARYSCVCVTLINFMFY